jgi:ferredoxin
MSNYSFCFSPTGGSLKVAEILCGELFDTYESINLLQKRNFDLSLSEGDLSIITVPSYAGRVPQICKERLSHLKGNHSKTILVVVFGNRAIDDTLIELYDIAEKCNFSVIAGIEAVAEHSLVRTFGKGRPDRDDVVELIGFVKSIKEKILSDNCSEPIMPGNRPYKEARSSPMTLALDSSCINCKRCAVECPVDAIDLEDVSFVDFEKCFSCLHCVTVCPTKARHNSPEVINIIEERLKDRCVERKENKLYL